MIKTQEPTPQTTVQDHVRLEVTDEHVIWETVGKEAASESDTVSNAQKWLFYAVGVIGLGIILFFHTAFFGTNWISLAIMGTGLPMLLIAAVLAKKLFLGNMAPQQKWVLTQHQLEHHFQNRLGHTTTHTYAKDNIRQIGFFPDRIVIRLKQSQRGFSTHVMSPPVSFSVALREQLMEAVQHRGYPTEC